MKSTNGLLLDGTIDYYYGDKENSDDYKKYTISLSTTSPHISITSDTGQTVIPPIRHYYVRLIANPFNDPHYEFSDTKVGEPEGFNALNTSKTGEGRLDIYKLATYVFERTNDETDENDGLRATISSSAHPFSIREKSGSEHANNFKLRGANKTGLTLEGHKLLMFTTEIYKTTGDGPLRTDANIEYYCTAHSGMVGAFKLLDNPGDGTSGYSALVDMDRNIESGHNIRLEIEGEEIKL